MLTATNLASWFRGSGLARELKDTQRAWLETQAIWTASPLARTDPDGLAAALAKEVISGTERRPALPILLACADVYYELYRAEVIGPIDPKWEAIAASVETASEFRQILPRRRRWAADFETMHAAWKRIVREATDTFFEALPECCFTRFDEDAKDSFEVPLLDLLDDAASLIDRLVMVPYGEEAMRLDLFHQLRDVCRSNLLIASGFRPDRDDPDLAHKLVRAQQQKKKTGAELAELYLTGSPFKPLLETPVPFRIPDALRFEHCHIVGGTGHGKTQLMQKMIHADLVAAQQDGRSVIVIDSQGDLINKLTRLDLFSPEQENSLAGRLVIVDPTDVEYPAALNLFDAPLDRVRGYGPADRERVLNGVIELYELFFGAFLGAELTQKQGVVFKYLARLMLAIPDATIHTLMRLMEDGKPFKPDMDKLDGSARYFFETEFFHPAFAATKKQVLRRLWGVLSTPAFERMFTQPRNKLDLFEAMNEGKIILVSTAKDLLKRDGSALLGRFFIAMITQAALERSTLPEHLRQPVFVYVDEAQEYFDENIETILNQARKYRVGLTLAHQTLDQLSPRLRSAILANTSLKCAGGVSAKDARALAEELRTTAEFIEGMRRKGPRTEFALWAKHLTGQAIRLSVPLGFLEQQPTLTEEEYATLLSANRARYCGVLADVAVHKLTPAEHTGAETPGRRPESPPDGPETVTQSAGRAADAPSLPKRPAVGPSRLERPRPETIPPVQRPLGKGGKQHVYLQALVKELAEQSGLKATLEAPLAGGSGQVDVLLERDGVVAAIEISVTTPVEHERANLQKCLANGFPKIAVVLAKSKSVQASYRTALFEIVPEQDRERVSFLTPEDLPGFILSLAPPPEPTARIVKGYRVTGNLTQISPENARARQEALAILIANSMRERN